MKIDKSIAIEELVEIIPDSITYLRDKGIRCILCGEPVWGTLEEAAKEKGFTEDDIALFIQELNALPVESAE